MEMMQPWLLHTGGGGGKESPQETLPSLTVSFREVKYYWDLQEAPVAEQPQP